MPHVILKMIAGRTAEQKQALADALTQAVMSTLGSKEASVSIAIEDVAAEDWTSKVYVPDIQGRADTIFKQPGYDPFK